MSSSSLAMDFLAISSELHLMVFAGLRDLDDARDLARTCKYFHQLHQGNKRSIAKAIIVSRH